MRTSAQLRALSSIAALCLLLPMGGAFSAQSASAFDYAQCSNGLDDDRDGRTDYPRDPECDSLDDNTESPNEGIFVTVTDNRETVAPGDALTYVITLKQQRETVKLVDVALHVPAQHAVVSISDDGTFSANGIFWTKVAVFNGNTRKLTVHVSVSPNVANDQMLVARVTADGSQATDTTMVSGGRAIPYPQNQLELSITDNRDQAGPGDILEYIVFVRNPEPNDTAVHVRVKIPVVLRVIDAVGADILGDEVVWKNVTLQSRDGRVFTFRAKVDDRAPKGYPIQVVARAGNVTASDRTTTGGDPYSLFSSITDNRDSAGRGDLLTYVIHIDNASGRLDSNASIDAAIPRYTEFVSASEGGVRDRENVRWLNMVLAPNGTRDLEFTVRVRSDAPDGALLRATALVQGQMPSDITQVAGTRNTYNAGGTYAGPLEVEKNSDRLSATAGSSISYTVTVRNSSNRSIRNVAVNDVFSASAFTVTDPGAGNVNSGRITWHIEELDAGESRTFTYRGRLSRSLRSGDEVFNTARAFSSDVGYIPTSTSSVDVGYSPYGNYGNNDYDYEYLPQTGIGDYFGPIENTAQFLSPVSAATGGNASPLLLWLIVIVAGLAGGVAMGKKFVI